MLHIDLKIAVSERRLTSFGCQALSTQYNIMGLDILPFFSQYQSGMPAKPYVSEQCGSSTTTFFAFLSSANILYPASFSASATSGLPVFQSSKTPSKLTDLRND